VGPWPSKPHLDRAGVEAAVSAAIAAPSVLNCQPWRFRAHDGLIDLLAAPDFAPAALDPNGREVFMSLGAALLNLRFGVEAQGCNASIQLMPSPLSRSLVARVRLGRATQLSAADRELCEAIPRRRSSRLPFSDEPVPYEDVAHLQDAASVEGANLDPATGWHRAAVVEALHDADQAQRTDPAVVSDVRGLTTTRDRSDVGIPAESLGPRPLDPSAPVRDLALGQHIAGRPAAEFETAGLLAVLLTTGDEPNDWLRAGMALERVLLTATVRGLAVGILSHATEEIDLRQVVRDPNSRWRHPQIVLRFGYGTGEMPPTPRRPLDEVLEINWPTGD
jgi:nitroreductase